ncbi:MAG: hypothetical protein MJ010_01205, partial [Paludibacteraceae bacterium]|nr:hypothetical protein [Paludibacteraceae bacterium]
TGFTYTLYKGETEISSLAGTGSALDFGKQKETGVYTIKAENTTTACSAIMTGSVDVTRMAITSTPIVNEYDGCPAHGNKKLSDLVVSDKTNLAFFDEFGNPHDDVFDASIVGANLRYYVTNTEIGKCTSERADILIQISDTIDYDLLVKAESWHDEESREVAAGRKVTLDAVTVKETQALSYQWWRNSRLIDVTDSEVTTRVYANTKFVVTATGRCNSITKDVTIRAIWPTLISPYDGNGKNDDFARGCRITVFNRFNEKVFEGSDGWDGTINGNMAKNGVLAEPGVYYYNLSTPDGDSHRGTMEVVKF